MEISIVFGDPESVVKDMKSLYLRLQQMGMEVVEKYHFIEMPSGNINITIIVYYKKKAI